MTETCRALGAQTPKTASRVPNVGFFVAFNLPVYRNKYRAGVSEADDCDLRSCVA